MISDQEVLEIARKIEDANNIDIKKTIEKAATAGYLGEEHFYCTVIEDGGLTHTVPEILGDRYKSQPLDNLYFDIISKSLDLDGIYISLGYCASNLIIPEEECSEIIEYDDTDNYFIKPVRPEFCIITSVENGVWRFSFDLDYFTQKTLRYLPEYGRDFEAAYWAYKGKKDLDGKWIIEPNKTKRWFEPKKQICVKFDPEMDWTVPPFVGIFKSIIDLDTYEEIKKE